MGGLSQRALDAQLNPLQSDSVIKPFKTLLYAFIIITICSMVLKGETFDQFTAAVWQVETGGRSGHIVGEHGELGPLQIGYKSFLDSRTAGEYKQCEQYKSSQQVVRNYLLRYARKAFEAHDWQTCARIYNGGPNGLRKKKTLDYWKKVKKHLFQ